MVAPAGQTRANVLLEDVNSRKRYPVSAGTTFGRTEADHRFPKDVQLSRKHFRVWVEGERILIQDLGSRNRTRVNGHPVTSKQAQEIRPGDVIAAGKLRLRVRDLDQPDAAPAAATRNGPTGKLTAAHLAGLIPHPDPAATPAPLGFGAAVRGFFTLRGWTSSTALTVSLSLAFFAIPEFAEILRTAPEAGLPHAPRDLALLFSVVAAAALPIGVFQHWIARRFLTSEWSRLGTAMLAITAIYGAGRALGNAVGYDRKALENRAYAACVDARTRDGIRCANLRADSPARWAELPASLRADEGSAAAERAPAGN